MVWSTIHQDAEKTRYHPISPKADALVSLTQTTRSVLLKFRRKTPGPLLTVRTQTHTDRLLSGVRCGAYSFPSMFFQYIKYYTTLRRYLSRWFIIFWGEEGKPGVSCLFLFCFFLSTVCISKSILYFCPMRTRGYLLLFELCSRLFLSYTDGYSFTTHWIVQVFYFLCPVRTALRGTCQSEAPLRTPPLY